MTRCNYCNEDFIPEYGLCEACRNDGLTASDVGRIFDKVQETAEFAGESRWKDLYSLERQQLTAFANAVIRLVNRPEDKKG